VGIRNEKSELFDLLNEAIKGREQEFRSGSPGKGKGRTGRDRQRELPRSSMSTVSFGPNVRTSGAATQGRRPPPSQVQQMNRRLQEVAYKLTVA
jgi:ribosomal protein L4